MALMTFKFGHTEGEANIFKRYKNPETCTEVFRTITKSAKLTRLLCNSPNLTQNPQK